MTKDLGRTAPARFDLSGFAWAVGIEDTAIGVPICDGGRTLDEYELTEHYARWRADLDMVADLGCTAMRYGLPWYRLNPAPDMWDWTWLDAVVDYATGSVGVQIIADLVHYGTPAWLPGAFTDPRYPEAIAAFAVQVAKRYGDKIAAYTPVNEPLVTASFCGERAVWPPYGHGDRGWASVVMGLARGIQATISALRATQPETTIVHVEATYVWNTIDADMHDLVEQRRLRNFLPTDLMTGRVTPHHPLYGWLRTLGVTTAALDDMWKHAVEPDAIGLNYYPTMSCREVVRHGDDIVSVAVDGGESGLHQVLAEFHARYRLPLLVAETGVEGEHGEQVDWLERCVKTVLDERAAGVPVVGFTWWPLFDFVDWGWASAGRVVEEFYVRDAAGQVHPVGPPGRGDDIESYLRRMGLYRLEQSHDGLRRGATQAVEAYRRLATRQVPPLPNRIDALTVPGKEREAS
ncbi:MAG: family 1 glycosylhydrolase [Actinomycetota bacterium]|nr:family 1 glycosylhydrolase [Actinomycetota bacterium]